MARIHPTAIVEEGVTLGNGTSIWDNAHVRGPASIGADCIIGEKTYIAYGVNIGDRVKLNAFVYVCTGVTLGDGVMVSAHATFTNDRYPRATTPDLTRLRSSEPDADSIPTNVGPGATIGASAVIGPGSNIGTFAMIGMGSVVTEPVPNHALVVGNPARQIGWVCACGPRIQIEEGRGTCNHCGRSYAESSAGLVEQ